jgi:NAD(P)H-hydrate epimerase
LIARLRQKSGSATCAENVEAMNDDAASQIAALLQQVGDVHHTVFADTEGADDDWATFYSDWLLHHSNFAKLLGRTPIRSHLTRDLVELDERYTKENPSEAWPHWYAAQLLGR